MATRISRNQRKASRSRTSEIRVAQPQALIDQADEQFAAFVRANHGAASKHSGCFFDRPTGGARTAISADVFCGPVLFYGGVAPAMYLEYAVQAVTPPAKGQVRLEASARPVSATPDRLPEGAVLERPDHRKPPVGADGLVAPGPPPAAANAITIVTASDVPNLPAAPPTAIMGSENITVTLESSGYVRQYGRGLATRSAAPGTRLLGFELRIGDGEYNP